MRNMWSMRSKEHEPEHEECEEDCEEEQGRAA